MLDGAHEFVAFMDAFVTMYPEYQNKITGRGFFISGESYAGKYIPLFARYMHDYKGNITVSGLLIGNPFASPII
jgi:carboxypeptidase C (cathepsin A)